MAARNATAAARVTAATNRGKALAARRQGASYTQIAADLHVSRKTAWQYVAHALAALATEQAGDAGALRQLEDDRLDLALRAIVGQVIAGHLGAVDRWLRLSESRRRLWGLDAPTRVDYTLLIQQEAERLGAELGLPPTDIVRRFETYAGTRR